MSEISNRSSFDSLADLARSRNIKVIEAEGLGDKNGLLFFQDGAECIAIKSDLTLNEKARALGFLLDKADQDLPSEPNSKITYMKC